MYRSAPGLLECLYFRFQLYPLTSLWQRLMSGYCSGLCVCVCLYVCICVLLLNQFRFFLQIKQRDLSLKVSITNWLELKRVKLNSRYCLFDWKCKYFRDKVVCTCKTSNQLFFFLKMIWLIHLKLLIKSKL